jgi:hypothetical protein
MVVCNFGRTSAVPEYDLRAFVDQENYLFNLFGMQHKPFEVKLAHNAMESFQQKVPPILFGAFEDIFD